MKHILLSIIILFSLNSHASVLDRGTISKKHYSESIPFELVNNMMVVSLLVKGKKYNFMFDTGAPNVFSPRVIKELNLKKREYTMDLHDISGETKTTHLFGLPKLTIGNVSFIDFDFTSFDTIETFPMSCFNLDGIIGYNLLRHSAVSIDYQKKIITLSDSYDGNPISEGYEPIGFTFFNDDPPQVAIFHEFGNLILGIDTGKNSGITLRHPELSNILHELGYKPDYVYKDKALGMYGLDNYDVEQYTLSGMYIGRLSIDNTEVTVEPMEGISLLGVSYLNKFKSIIDFPSRILWLKPLINNESSTDSFNYGFNVELNETGKMMVSNVVKGKSAALAGLQDGDQIIGINGIEKWKFSQNDYCNMYLDKSSDLYFRGEKKLTLTVTSKSETKNIEISYKE